jgi:hypothetical protein
MAYGTINAEQLTTQSGYTLGAGNASSFKNRIINGAMVIDQRNAGASVSNANGYTLDRWYFMRGNSSSNPIFNVIQSTTVPSNYKNSLLVTVATSGAPGANNYSALYQVIEGLNVSDFGFGTATATGITLSFWVNCSVTGTYGVAFQNSANNRSYVASYTVNAASTWEQKTITITGDTSGTWLTTNGAGLSVYWDMGVGTGQSTTAGSWQAGNYIGLTGGTKLSNTSAATFYITGVQLEVGTVATSFDYRSIGTETALCQRYFQQLMGSSAISDQYQFIGSVFSPTRIFTHIFYKMQMRVAPTITANSLSVNANGNSTSYASTFVGAFQGVSGTGIEFTTAGAPTSGIAVSIDVASGTLTASSEL